MNEHTIGLVRESFDLVEPMASQVGARFYAHLFRVDPSLTALFSGDREAQGDRLVQMIAVAVAQLHRPEVLLPVLRQLGRRHAGYGVRDAHYGTVGGVLLLTLAEALGPAFTEEVREAWIEVYALMAATMRDAAAAPEAAAAAAP
ncbi:globin domain-containing protein [Piscinibacter sakaiensis]|uniref:Putative bacterial haemoglobin n=1 Tax=Piscinibacter sakaiensis TaxID=1547922 RepID=A0A0K8P160_PISS1|nr:globin domain-containing protein [Piscinibacter sakaiensis]GAP36274.1 putative bacterial haemoglobin [Piscinibacter sakaiensis]